MIRFRRWLSGVLGKAAFHVNPEPISFTIPPRHGSIRIFGKDGEVAWAVNTEAIKRQQDELAAELKRQNDFRERVAGSQSAAIIQSLHEFFKGDIGGQA